MEGILSGLNGRRVQLHVEEAFTQEHGHAPTHHLKEVVEPVFNKTLERIMILKLVELLSVMVYVLNFSEVVIWLSMFLIIKTVIFGMIIFVLSGMV